MLSVFRLLLVKVFAPPSAIVPVVPSTLRLPAAVPPDSQLPPLPDSVSVFASMSRLPALMIPRSEERRVGKVCFGMRCAGPDIVDMVIDGEMDVLVVL